MIGKTIVQYRILEELGRGGMGIVYKAQDEKLDRLVALKFLPHHVSVGEIEKNRFLQEAQAAATLNHPNICTIHDIKEEEGQQFIVMEFVDGMTLRKKFEGEPLKVGETITFGIQIGEALQEAHGKGIVHRDIKADNIMVNSKNRIKVMDFGLAKLKGSLKLTRSSSTVGTLAYMAPEQIQGGEVDLRSDVFSFGVVLFEMLTGRTPFRGEHEAAMVYSITNEEPESVDKFRQDVPQDLQHIIRGCLEKDPEDRYQSMNEIVRELRRIQKQWSRVSRQSAAHIPVMHPEQHFEPAPSGTVSVAPRLASKRYFWIGAIGGAVLLLAGVYFLLLRNPAPKLNPDMTFPVLQVPFSQITYPGLSPDGNWIAFGAADQSGKWDVYFMNSAGGEPRRITHDSSVFVTQTDISPDGSQIVYSRPAPVTFNGEIRVVSSLGGFSKRVAEKGIVERWRPDGKRIGYHVFQTNAKSKKLEFWSVSPNGGDNRLEFVDTVSVPGRISLSWSPDGRSIAWLRSYSLGQQEVFIRNLETGAERQLTFGKKVIDEVCWTPQNDIIYSSEKSGNTNLWIVSAGGGSPEQLTKGSGPDIGMKISADGRKLLYLQQQRLGYLWRANLDGSNAQHLTFDEIGMFNPSYAPDGKKILAVAADPDPLKYGTQLFLMDRDGSNRRPLTSGGDFAFTPRWSPNGKRIVYTSRLVSDPIDSARVQILEIANPGALTVVTNGSNARWVDEKKILFYRNDRARIRHLETGVEDSLLTDSTFVVVYRENEFVLYGDVHAGREGWWVISPKEAKSGSLQAAQLLLKFAEFQSAAISRDGSYALVIPKQGELWKISLPDGKKQTMKSSVRDVQFSISPDGKELVYVDSRLSSKLVLIDNLYK